MVRTWKITALQHKKAWEFDAYDFLVRTAGTPEVRASKDKENVETGISNHGNPLVYFSKKRENVLVYLSDE